MVNVPVLENLKPFSKDHFLINFIERLMKLMFDSMMIFR